MRNELSALQYAVMAGFYVDTMIDPRQAMFIWNARADSCKRGHAVSESIHIFLNFIILLYSPGVYIPCDVSWQGPMCLDCRFTEGSAL